jgi:alkylhydroperoxidase/carboxymuconolactone decarboxylase family protein YurZ
MTAPPAGYPDEDAVADAYRRVLGDAPPLLHDKFDLFDAAGAPDTLLAVEAARARALDTDALDPVTVQLIQFAICCALHLDTGAAVHARAAAAHGASTAQLAAAATTAWVVAGFPALNTGAAAIRDTADGAQGDR